MDTSDTHVPVFRVEIKNPVQVFGKKFELFINAVLTIMAHYLQSGTRFVYSTFRIMNYIRNGTTFLLIAVMEDVSSSHLARRNAFYNFGKVQ